MGKKMVHACLHPSIRFGRVDGSAIDVAVLLQQGEHLYRKILIRAIAALHTMFLERTHQENIHEVKGFLGYLVYSVALDEKYVFMSKVHERKVEG